MQSYGIRRPSDISSKIYEEAIFTSIKDNFFNKFNNISPAFLLDINNTLFFVVEMHLPFSE